MVGVTTLIQATFLGLQIGMTLILIAAGLTLIFGMMDVINVAHGSLYMLGAYFGLTLVQATGNFWLAVVLAPVLVGIVGVVIEMLSIRPLQGRNPLYHILLTFGLLIVIEEAVSVVWGAQVQNITTPEVVDGTLVIGSIAYSEYRAFLLVSSTIVVAAIWLALSRSDFGILMKASAHDAEMVSALGVNVTRVFTVVFGAGAALAGLAGVLLGAQRGFEPTTGVAVIIEAFAVVVIGGLGSFRGAVVGAILVGLLEAYLALLAPAIAELSVFVMMAVVLLLRPAGLFGEVAA
ncbi:MAG: branched-chain amino acid ABC transporter permease [Halobacteriales archaeon]